MITLLIWIVVILAVIVIARTIRILELVDVLGGRHEEADEITEKDNKTQAKLLLAFLFVGLGGMTYFTLDAKKYLLPIAASKHGVLTDDYLYINFAIIIVVFVITQLLLFGYGFKYRHRKANRAYFYPLNHKLEFIWTVIPSIVLMGLIVYGLKLWSDITAPAPKNAMVIEIYGKQFDWTARYGGKDNTLGFSNFKMITDENPLGVDERDAHSKDDKIARDLHIPVNTPIVFKIHSRDVIHSFYMPHLRAQMNAVPGMTTEISLLPTITTAEMKKITNNPKFEFIVLCNKVCGVAHYNMKMNLVIESAADFNKWYQGQGFVFEEKTAVADSTKGIAMK